MTNKYDITYDKKEAFAYIIFDEEKVIGVKKGEKYSLQRAMSKMMELAYDWQLISQIEFKKQDVTFTREEALELNEYGLPVFLRGGWDDSKYKMVMLSELMPVEDLADDVVLVSEDILERIE